VTKSQPGAGVPVYAEHGTGGGYALLDNYRTNLTGLNEDEVRALFMLSLPAPLAELGVSRELKAALLKLSAALPAARRSDEAHVRQRVHLDWSGWFQAEEPVPHLSTIQQAVWQDRKLYLAYHLPFETVVERRVDAYGLVAKSGAWYLVCARDGHLCVQRVSHVLQARLADEGFERRADFDLVAFWEAWCADYERNRPSYTVTARVAADLIPCFPHYFGDGVQEMIAGAGPPDGEGWITLTLSFETFEAARERFLGLGGAAEVLEPHALRESVSDFAAQIVALYTR
jgi:predicted DNA-binding transcriptional regulator YafY